MTSRDITPHLGGTLAVILFIFTLLAFVMESQLTQYVQTTLGYRQPFFLFYVVHSSFWVIFPLHFLYLTATTSNSPSALWKGLIIATKNHLSPQASNGERFPFLSFSRQALALAIGLTCPALLWFAAVSLASLSDVTAIWNTNAFFAYIITVKVFGLKWESRKLIAVLLATLGVLAVVYGGTTVESGKPRHEHAHLEAVPRLPTFKPSAPLVGDLLTLVASIGYGLYQVLYKKYAALPSDPELASENLYRHIPNDTSGLRAYDNSDSYDVVNPPPFGLHANMMTSIIGLLTFATLWIPLPFLHYFGIETFILPSSAKTVVAIGGIALSGVVFNAGFMVLLGVWGPVIVSVGNLLTIVLVFVSDMIFGAGLQSLTLWSLSGCSVIVAAFSVLAYDMFTDRS